MMLARIKQQAGVTLVEVLLVMVILSSFIFMGVNYMTQKTTNERIERTALQMQQIMNAAMAYYVANGAWPIPTGGEEDTELNADNFTESITSDIYNFRTNYLPSPSFNQTPWFSKYKVYVDAESRNFYVYLTVTTKDAATSSAYAKIVAGKLPSGYAAESTNIPPLSTDVCPTTATGETPTAGACQAIASVNIPGQNLNNASAINFAGLYHHGGCVPVPSCPVDKNGKTMTPSVFIVPVSVSGVNDAGSGSTNVYPISSFTGYATGNAPLNKTPPACNAVPANPANEPTCPATPTGVNYWRACLDLVTERGSVPGTPNWGQYVTLMALTRCAISNEPAGSPFTVYSN